LRGAPSASAIRLVAARIVVLVFHERSITCSLEGHAMQTRILTKWFEAQEGFGAIRLNTVTAILSIVAIAAAITAFSNMQLANVG
jgi:hypothetical protein